MRAATSIQLGTVLGSVLMLGAATGWGGPWRPWLVPDATCGEPLPGWPDVPIPVLVETLDTTPVWGRVPTPLCQVLR